LEPAVISNFNSSVSEGSLEGSVLCMSWYTFDIPSDIKEVLVANNFIFDIDLLDINTLREDTVDAQHDMANAKSKVGSQRML